MMMGNRLCGYGMFGGGGFMMLLLLMAIGFIFYSAFKKQSLGSNGRTLSLQKPADSEALKIAKTRLARGEISVEEFEKIRRNLL